MGAIIYHYPLLKILLPVFPYLHVNIHSINFQYFVVPSNGNAYLKRMSCNKFEFRIINKIDIDTSYKLDAVFIYTILR